MGNRYRWTLKRFYCLDHRASISKANGCTSNPMRSLYSPFLEAWDWRKQLSDTRRQKPRQGQHILTRKDFTASLTASLRKADQTVQEWICCSLIGLPSFVKWEQALKYETNNINSGPKPLIMATYRKSLSCRILVTTFWLPLHIALRPVSP